MALTWTLRSNPSSNGWNRVIWVDDLSLFIAIGSTSAGSRFLTSPDGITWTAQTATFNTRSGIIWTGSKLVALGSQTTVNNIQTSPDGVNWTAGTSSSIGGTAWNSLAWSSALTLMVAVGENKIQTSPDGVTWTSRVSPANNLWNAVAWSPTLALFVALSTRSIDVNGVMTSPDGITWTLHPSIGSGIQVANVVWSTFLNLFVACDNNNGLGQNIITSPDGTNWTIRANPVGKCPAIVSCDNINLLVTTQRQATAGLFCASSPDGITWTSESTPVDNTWTGLAYSPSLSLLVAVCEFGASSTAEIMTAAGLVPPVTNAGPDQNIYTSTTILAGSVTGGSPTALWTKVSGPGDVIFEDNTSVTSEVTFSKSGAYILRLTGTNAAGSTNDDVTITIITNTIYAGDDTNALLSDGIDLAATYVVQNIPATYLWSKKSGPGDVTFATPTALACHASFTKNGKYLLKIQATNGPLVSYSYILVTVLDLAALPIASEV